MRSISPTITRTRVRFRATQRIHAEPEAIFPLLCPVREHDWIPAWSCDLVYTESGVAEEGCVFQTDRPEDGGLDTWVVSRYEPTERLSFVRINPLRVMRYDIRLESQANGSTALRWEQEITALSDDGDRHVAALRQEDFSAMIASEERLLEHYLRTGEALETPG